MKLEQDAKYLLKYTTQYCHIMSDYYKDQMETRFCENGEHIVFRYVGAIKNGTRHIFYDDATGCYLMMADKIDYIVE